MRQSMDFFESHSSGDILARFTNDIFMVNRGLSGVFVKLMREPFKALAFLAVAISVDPLLTLVGLCILPPVLYALIRIGKKVRRSVRRSLQKIASLASVVNETVNGITIVKGYNMEEYELSRVRVEIMKLRKFLLNMIKADAATGPITEFILVVGVVIFVMFSGQRVLSGSLHAGDLVTLYFALAMMLDPVRKLSSVNNMVQTSVASAERVFEFIDVQPTIAEAPNAIDIPPLSGSIRFEDVHFAYDGKSEVLKGISFEAVKGEMIALVGFSGAGKSTLVKLIPRFYDVTSGAITIDGIDIRQASFHSLRDLIGIVTQDTILFDETVRDNIAFGRAEYDPARVTAAAKAAHADEFVSKLPQGYDTPLGAAGSILSGGQRQRLAIARAIIKDPRILILDEATSSLDSESERLIQQALDGFVEGRTTFVIAHRLSTIQRADRILVLDQGRIAEQGTHEELLRAGGIYQRLYETQFAPAAAN
jgi:subfamily B ATP-binding cassette protein MsbA